MLRFAITFLLGCIFGTTALAAPLERWVYAQVNLLVPAEAERLEVLMRRARPLGYTHFLLADSKFTRMPQMDAPYAGHVNRIRKIAEDLGIEIVPAVFPVGYSNDLLWFDPNLAEGLPVRDALFVVSNGVARVVADPPVSLPRLNQRQRWGFVDENLQPDQDQDSLRVTDPKGANARIMARVRVSPFRQYHVSVRIKTREFRGQPEIKVLAGGDRSLSFTSLKTKPTQDWKTHDITFNSFEQTNVNVYLGAWGANSGSLWLADARIEEAGPVNILRREGCPLLVRIDGAANSRKAWTSNHCAIRAWAISRGRGNTKSGTMPRRLARSCRRARVSVSPIFIPILSTTDRFAPARVSRSSISCWNARPAKSTTPGARGVT